MRIGLLKRTTLTSADPGVGRLTAMCSHTQITQFSMAPGDCRGDQVASHIAGDARVATVEAESLTVTASQGGTAADRRFRAADFCVARPCGRTQINQIFAT